MRNTRNACLAVALLLATPLAALCDPADDFSRAEIKRQGIPGLSLVVLKNGEVIKAAGYGLADRKLQIAAAPDTVYKIASGSKQFIASGIMLLVQEGRIGLDDRLTAFVDGAPAAWNAITIRNLLTHTAGLIRESPAFDPLKVRSDAEILRGAYAVPLRFPPGQKWEYSNTGYYALAEIIRKVSRQPWGDYIAAKIFRPLGMDSTRTTPTTTTEKIARFAQGYVDNDAPRDAPQWVALRPSGAFLSTVLDLAKWDAALRSERILTAATLRQMWTPATLSDGGNYPYGFGWMMATLKGHRLIHHPGGMPGFRSDIARFVDDGVTIIVLMNMDDVDIDAIVGGLAAVYLPQASAAQTREVRVMSSGATAPAYLAMTSRFESTTRQKAVTLATATGVGADAIVSRIRSGEPVDVVFLASNAMDELVKDGFVVPASRIDIARSAIGIAVKSGAAKPDISSVKALTQALLQAKSIAISAQISGVYLTNELLPRLGIAAEVMPKIRRAEKEPVGNIVARGDADLGIQQISELMAVGGVDYLGPLPAEVQRVSTFAVGVVSKAPNPSGAKALIDLVTSPEGFAIMRRSGLDPIPRKP